MPQVDLETLVSVCAGGAVDRKITCVTLADTGTGATEEQGLPGKDEHIPVEDVPPDFPPESFWLSKDAEFDWFDRNAFLERKESTKGGIAVSSNSNPAPSSNSNSQRFSMNLKSKASIIGLPKTQKPNFIDCKRRNNKPANVQLFPKRSQSAGKSALGMVEPSSPKVSCMGRVRSKRSRRRSAEHSRKKEKSVGRSRSDDHEKRRKGLYSRVLSMFGGRRDKKTGRSRSDKVQVQESTTVEEEAPRRSAAFKMREFPIGTEPAIEPPALGGMKKFASGRRSGSWSTDDFDVALSDSLVDGPTRRS